MNNSINTKSLTVWRLMDGNAGHEKQSQALAEGLANQCNINLIHINIINNAFTYWIDWIFKQEPKIKHREKPDIIIGAGHKTHIAMLAAKRYYNCKAIVIMKPSLPLWLFDVIIAPKHDFINTSPPNNVINTLTALAPSISSQIEKNKGLILLGGISKHFKWNDITVAQQIKLIAKSLPDNIQWTLSTSRRTPENTLFKMEESFREFNNIDLFNHKDLSKDWLENQLKKSCHIIVTSDSISMIAEALNTKANIYAVELESKREDNKINYTLSLLKSRDLLSLGDPTRPQKTKIPLDQHYECAKNIIEHYL